MAIHKKQAKVLASPVLDTCIEMCWIKNCTDTNPQVASSSIRYLAEQFLAPQTDRGVLTLTEYLASDKKIRHKEKNGGAFIPAVFSKPNTRAQDDVLTLTAFVLDFDGDVYRTEFEPILKQFCYLAFTTYSHSKIAEHWRVVIFHASPASPSEHELIYWHFHKLFQGRLDNRSRTLNQLWYSPACPPDAGNLYQCFVNDAPLLIPSIVALEGKAAQANVGSIELQNMAKAQPKKYPQRNRVDSNKLGSKSPYAESISEKVTKLSEALRHICADDRGNWIKVGMALKQEELGDAALDMWLQWSKTSNKYCEEDAISNWKSFKDKDDGVALGTIYYLARQAVSIPATAAANMAAIEELNGDHFIARENGKTCAFRQKCDSVTNRKYLERMMPKDVSDFYRNRKIDVPTKNGEKQIGLGDYWLGHPDRRTYNDVVFAPNREIRGSYNLWRGLAVTPIEGKWIKMQYHIREVICAGNEELYKYVLGWMACAIQHPDCPGEVALVLQGARGAGKGSFVQPFGSLFGQHFLQVTQARHLVGDFNAHLRDCIVLFADEAFWAGDRQGENVLKALITEPTIFIEPKGVNSFSVRNHLHVIIASNSDWVIPAGERERRYCVLQVRDIHAQDTNYFALLKAEVEGGGLPAMLYDLQKMDVSTFNIRNVPFTVGLSEQILRSLPPERRWWYEELMSGDIWNASSKLNIGTGGQSRIVEAATPPYSIARDTLQQRFAQACHGLHASRGSVTELGMLLPKLLPTGWPQDWRACVSGGRAGTRQYVLPSLAVARKHFEQITGLIGAFDGESGSTLVNLPNLSGKLRKGK